MAEGALAPRPLSLVELAATLRGATPARSLPTVCFTASAGEPAEETRVLLSSTVQGKWIHGVAARLDLSSGTARHFGV